MRNVTWGGRSAIAVAATVLGFAVAGRISNPAHAASDLHRLPLHLADTGAFEAANRPFAPQYPLWSDGLGKQRRIYLPPGTTIDAREPYDWKYPVGTKIWKDFSLNGRKVETRMFWKASAAGWIGAAYVWNADGTDARLAPEDGVPGAVEVAPGKRHSIPSRNDCAACHGAKQLEPIGFNALQLSGDRDPNALHAESLRPGMLTLKTLVDEKLITGLPADFVVNPPRIATADPQTRTVLGYLAANCAMCHNGRGEIAALAPKIRLRDLVEDGDAVARSLISQPTRWQVPSVRDGESVVVHPGQPALSAMLVRMRSRSPSSQMPPLGTVVRDQKAVDAVAAWIASRK